MKDSIPEVAKKHGVSAQTIDGCGSFGTLEPADVKRRRPGPN